MQARTSENITGRITSIDLLRGLVMVIMALDHVRMYFGYGTWYASPTDLASTTPLLFFTRWITHFCAPVFLFLAGTSAFLRGSKNENIKHTGWFLFTRGLWLVFVEIIIVTFGWTFDITFSLIILQVIWAIGISMILLSVLVFLPMPVIFAIGIALVFGHNLLDPIRTRGAGIIDYIWYILHQPAVAFLNGRTLDIHYPVLPWAGLMTLGYVFGNLYRKDFPRAQRTLWLLASGIGAFALFILLRLVNAYGEPVAWQPQGTGIFTLISFLNTTKYPPSLQFMLMTVGPALIFLALIEYTNPKTNNPLVVFGRVPFFFYIIHIYLIHVLALLALIFSGRDWHEYILSATALQSGRLIDFGFGLGTVYAVWVAVVVALYPLCRWYQKVRENNRTKWWLSYL
jgi:uncharacterized membrane protein